MFNFFLNKIFKHRSQALQRPYLTLEGHLPLFLWAVTKLNQLHHPRSFCLKCWSCRGDVRRGNKQVASAGSWPSPVQTKGMPRMTDLKPNRFNSPSPPEAAGDLLGMSQVKMCLSGGKGNDRVPLQQVSSSGVATLPSRPQASVRGRSTYPTSRPSSPCSNTGLGIQILSSSIPFLPSTSKEIQTQDGARQSNMIPTTARLLASTTQWCPWLRVQHWTSVLTDTLIRHGSH